MCSYIGGRCNWCRWRWPVPLLRPLSTTERSNNDRCMSNGDRRLRRVELRQCKGTSCAVGWARTWRSARLSYRLSFSCRLYLYIYKCRQFYTQKSRFGLGKTQSSIGVFEHSKNILQNRRAPTRRKEKACARKLWNLQSAHCVCVYLCPSMYTCVGVRARIFLRSLPRAQSVSLTH